MTGQQPDPTEVQHEQQRPRTPDRDALAQAVLFAWLESGVDAHEHAGKAEQAVDAVLAELPDVDALTAEVQRLGESVRTVEDRAEEWRQDFYTQRLRACEAEAREAALTAEAEQLRAANVALVNGEARDHWWAGFRQGKSAGRGAHGCLDCESGDPHACVVAERDGLAADLAAERARRTDAEAKVQRVEALIIGAPRVVTSYAIRNALADGGGG